MNIEKDGVYVYNRNTFKWFKKQLTEPYLPREDGLYLIYFRNRMCLGCKAFDKIWIEYVEKHKHNDNIKEFIVVQCSNFFYECSDEIAADTFILYLVLETPQVIAIIVENKTPIYIEREISIDDIKKLEEFVNNIYSRVKEYLEENSSEQAEHDNNGLYIDFDLNNLKSVVSKIKKIIFEGKNPKEVCDEKGCRIIVD